MAKMNWNRAAPRCKPSLDYRREFDRDDAAAKWLRQAQGGPPSQHPITLAKPSLSPEIKRLLDLPESRRLTASSSEQEI
jgi:hypothetical protein